MCPGIGRDALVSRAAGCSLLRQRGLCRHISRQRHPGLDQLCWTPLQVGGWWGVIKSERARCCGGWQHRPAHPRALSLHPALGVLLLLNLCSWGRCGFIQRTTTQKKAIALKLLPQPPIALSWLAEHAVALLSAVTLMLLRVLKEMEIGTYTKAVVHSLGLIMRFVLMWRLPLISCCIHPSFKVGLDTAKYRYYYFSCFKIPWLLEMKQPYI